MIEALRSFRPNAGTAPQEFVQRASVAAWDDEAHVEETRERYARSARCSRRCSSSRRGSSEATFYLWFRVPDGESSEELATRLLEHGVVVAPGSYFGPSRRGLRAARARAVGRGMRARGRDPARRSCERRGDDRGARPRRDPRRREAGRRVGRERGREGGDPRVLPRAQGRAAGARPRSSTATRFRSSTATRSSACASCRPRPRASARSSRAT